jgi:hypothetical protein
MVLAVQVEMRGLEKYIPPTKMNDAAYRASRLVVMRQMMYPMQPTPMGPENQLALCTSLTGRLTGEMESSLLGLVRMPSVD